MARPHLQRSTALHPPDVHRTQDTEQRTEHKTQNTEQIARPHSPRQARPAPRRYRSPHRAKTPHLRRQSTGRGARKTSRPTHKHKHRTKAQETPNKEKSKEKDERIEKSKKKRKRKKHAPLLALALHRAPPHPVLVPRADQEHLPRGRAPRDRHGRQRRRRRRCCGRRKKQRAGQRVLDSCSRGLGGGAWAMSLAPPSHDPPLKA
ncbi:hypothetical protein B0H15DRAFT_860284 [Mycena belliarum]|uniref:Uncharacterized protein n=1 Tax=Mycena belliarum TaxID=1033014 RepID=A0AAD6TYH3_9AGAR|nr:hypothetical protein B0H15DRAFT_860284 [Mycena belliae]